MALNDNTLGRVQNWSPIDRPVSGCYHFYSDGTVCPILFDGRDDYVHAMNLAAILSILYGVSILSICLMSNHFHMVIRGSREACRKFALIYHRQLSKLLPNVDGRSIRVTMDPIQTETELMTKIAYVQRNCMSAGYAYLPSSYPWGSGDIFFRPESSFDHGTCIGSLPQFQVREMFGTRVDLPKEWEYDSSGMILRQFWIDWRYVNELFRSPNRFIAFLHQRREVANEIRIGCSNHLVEDLSQKELRRKVADLAVSLTSKSLVNCTVKEKLLIAKQVWASSLGYSLKSIARATHLDPDVLSAVLE